MKTKFKEAYMSVAHIFANLSSATRLKVGCVVVKNNQIISTGYNGTPPGEDNCCEDENGKTKDNVSHAEENALMKICASTESSAGSTVFITHAPCISCAKLMANAKVECVIYGEEYRSNDGIKYLQARNITIERLQLTK